MLSKSARFLIIILLVLGLFFRFGNLDQKLYWVDECFTSLRIAGYTIPDLKREVFNGKIISNEDIQKFQNINSEHGLFDTLKGLAVEEPQITPIYFILARFWAQLFGSSVTVMRSLPALISLFIFPAIYWLCIELFESFVVGWLAIALVAISPVHLFYAQQARPYSLWAVMILLSSAALLRAMRIKTKLNWAIYGATTLLALYSHLLSGLVIIAHILYIVIIERFRLTKTLIAYLGFIYTSIFIFFAPWILLIINNRTSVSDRTDWINSSLPRSALIGSWRSILSNIFINWNDKYETLFLISHNIFRIIFIIPIVILVLYSFYFICLHSSMRVWLFILILMTVTISALVIPDLVFGGKRSSIDRYHFPSILCIELTVAYLLTNKVKFQIYSSQQTKIWQFFTVILISVGVLSCSISSQTETWGGKDNPIIQESRIINQTNYPLVISDKGMRDVIPLSHQLNPKVKFLLIQQPSNLTEINDNFSDGFSDVFLFHPAKEFLLKLQDKLNVNFQPVYQQYPEKMLWRLEKG
ncbi:glycosyltransferase family 39 protein [Nostoc sp.]|uniref:glycosyltransferase family 39 protein n=1 Tax=Nostoc sp. TaxID=1180 RepID=UPI00359308BC